MKKFRETKKISFPNDRGVTGQVFKTREVVWTNEMNRMHKFNADIDN